MPSQFDDLPLTRVNTILRVYGGVRAISVMSGLNPGVNAMN